MTTTPPSPADLRALLARERVAVYLVAARVRVHPSRLSAMLHERVPMPADLAAELAGVIRGQAAPDGARTAGATSTPPGGRP